jgi:hypothetical protein
MRYNEWTLDQFKTKAYEVHGGLYDYSLSEYNGYVNLIKIVCPIHGEFHQRVKSHIDGHGCRKCCYQTVSDKNSPWTKSQLNYLLENFEKISLAKIAEHIGFCHRTVQNKARKLKLIKQSTHIHHTIPNFLWINLCRGAKDRNFVVSLTIDDIWNLYIKQNKKCELTGWDIEFSRKRRLNTASVDRIDSSKGYTKDNIQIVHKRVNKLKMDFSQDCLIRMCKSIARNKHQPREISHWEEDIWNDTVMPVYVDRTSNPF